MLTQYPVETVSKIAEFLGRSLTEEQIANIVQKTRFDVMKDDSDVKFKMHPFLMVFNPKEALMRKGTYTVQTYY